MKKILVYLFVTTFAFNANAGVFTFAAASSAKSAARRVESEIEETQKEVKDLKNEVKELKEKVEELIKILEKQNEKTKKRIKTGEERCLLFNLYHNKLFKQKVIPNKKKNIKKFNWKKDIADYLNIEKMILVLK